MKSYIKEIGLFLKKYLTSIILGTIVIAGAFIAFIFFQNRAELQNKIQNGESTETTEEGAELNPAFFRFYMKLPDGYSFQNGLLMDEILNSPVTYEQLDAAVSFEIEEYFEEPAEATETTTTQEVERFRMIDVHVDPNSNVFTIIAELGDPERNDEVIDFYYDALVNEELEVLEDNEIFVLNEPGYINDSQFDPDFYDNISETYVQPRLIDVWDIIIAVTFALFLMLLISILREVFNKTLNYSFAYNTGDSYDSLLFDEKTDDFDLVRYFVGSPRHTNKVLLSEKPLDREMVEGLEAGNELNLTGKNADQICVSNLTTLADFKLTEDIQEVVVFVESHETTRDWYKQEINYSRVLKLPVKTVHFMN